MADVQDIKNRFGFHPATDETKPLHQEVRALFVETATKLNELVPAGREQALVLTSLEEASFWANAGIARVLAPLKEGE